MSKWMIALMILSLPAMARSETQYIVDQLTVPLRRGPTNGHKIIHAGLPSGTALEIVGEDAAAGFTQVRLQNGTEGWLPTQYLTREPAARERLAAAQKRLETLNAELSGARQGTKSEQTARSSAEERSAELDKQTKQLQAELAEIKRVSSNAVAMYEEHKALKAHAAELERRNADQTAQIQVLKSNELQVWLLFGGGLVVLGLVLGVIIKSRPKTKSGW